jgi:hypothetical protein
VHGLADLGLTSQTAFHFLRDCNNLLDSMEAPVVRVPRVAEFTILVTIDDLIKHVDGVTCTGL